MSSTFDTFKDLISDVTDDYKKALDDLLDRDDDTDRGRKKKDTSLSALAAVPGMAALPLGAVHALVDAGAAAPALAGLMASGAAANPLAALTGAAGPMAAAANPMALLGGGTAGNPLSALGQAAGAAGNLASPAETLVALPGLIAQLTEAITNLVSMLPAAATTTATAAAARKG